MIFVLLLDEGKRCVPIAEVCRIPNVGSRLHYFTVRVIGAFLLKYIIIIIVIFIIIRLKSVPKKYLITKKNSCIPVEKGYTPLLLLQIQLLEINTKNT